MRYAMGQVMTLQENLTDLEKLMGLYHEAAPNLLVWAVREKLTKHFLGTCALDLSKEGRFEIGIRLLRSQWGRGIGGELTPALICHGFLCYPDMKCIAYIDKRNLASQRMSEAYLNFVEERYNAEEGIWDRYYSVDRQSFLQKGIYTSI